jgi:hypothetical protein
MDVRWALQGELREPCANQAGCTCTRLAVTSAFMAPAHVNSQGSMKVGMPDHSLIPPWHFARLLLGLLWISTTFLLLPTLPTTIPPLFIKARNMPRERGKSRRGPLYYSAFTRRNRLPPPSSPSLSPVVSRPQQNQPPTPIPTNDPGSGPFMEEFPPPENLPLRPAVALKLTLQEPTLQTISMALVLAWWRKKFPPAGKWQLP